MISLWPILSSAHPDGAQSSPTNSPLRMFGSQRKLSAATSSGGGTVHPHCLSDTTLDSPRKISVVKLRVCSHLRIFACACVHKLYRHLQSLSRSSTTSSTALSTSPQAIIPGNTTA